MTERGQLHRDDSFSPVGWDYKYITGTGVTVVKSTPGFLHAINFNNATVTNVTLNDASSGTTGCFASITVPSSSQLITKIFDITFANGLTVNVGTASDITISFV